MLSLFPIHFLALFAYFLLRVCAGFLVFHLGTKMLFSSSRPRGWLIFSISAMGAGMLLIVGLFTQAAALVTLLISIFLILMPRATLRSLLPDTYFWVLLIGVSLSLFITGAGVFAIDLPI